MAFDPGLAGDLPLAAVNVETVAFPPLAAAAQLTLTVPEGGVTGGITGGVTGGITGGVTGGVTGVVGAVVNDSPDCTATLPAASADTTW